MSFIAVNAASQDSGGSLKNSADSSALNEELNLINDLRVEYNEIINLMRSENSSSQVWDRVKGILEGGLFAKGPLYGYQPAARELQKAFLILGIEFSTLFDSSGVQNLAVEAIEWFPSEPILWIKLADSFSTPCSLVNLACKKFCLKTVSKMLPFDPVIKSELLLVDETILTTKSGSSMAPKPISSINIFINWEKSTFSQVLHQITKSFKQILSESNGVTLLSTNVVVHVSAAEGEVASLASKNNQDDFEGDTSDELTELNEDSDYSKNLINVKRIKRLARDKNRSTSFTAILSDFENIVRCLAVNPEMLQEYYNIGEKFDILISSYTSDRTYDPLVSHLCSNRSIFDDLSLKVPDFLVYLLNLFLSHADTDSKMQSWSSYLSDTMHRVITQIFVPLKEHFFAMSTLAVSIYWLEVLSKSQDFVCAKYLIDFIPIRFTTHFRDVNNVTLYARYLWAKFVVLGRDKMHLKNLASLLIKFDRQKYLIPNNKFVISLESVEKIARSLEIEHVINDILSCDGDPDGALKKHGITSAFAWLMDVSNFVGRAIDVVRLAVILYPMILVEGQLQADRVILLACRSLSIVMGEAFENLESTTFENLITKIRLEMWPVVLDDLLPHMSNGLTRGLFLSVCNTLKQILILSQKTDENRSEERLLSDYMPISTTSPDKVHTLPSNPPTSDILSFDRTLNQEKVFIDEHNKCLDSSLMQIKKMDFLGKVSEESVFSSNIEADEIFKKAKSLLHALVRDHLLYDKKSIQSIIDGDVLTLMVEVAQVCKDHILEYAGLKMLLGTRNLDLPDPTGLLKRVLEEFPRNISVLVGASQRLFVEHCQLSSKDSAMLKRMLEIVDQYSGKLDPTKLIPFLDQIINRLSSGVEIEEALRRLDTFAEMSVGCKGSAELILLHQGTLSRYISLVMALKMKFNLPNTTRIRKKMSIDAQQRIKRDLSLAVVVSKVGKSRAKLFWLLGSTSEHDLTGLLSQEAIAVLKSCNDIKKLALRTLNLWVASGVNNFSDAENRLIALFRLVKAMVTGTIGILCNSSLLTRPNAGRIILGLINDMKMTGKWRLDDGSTRLRWYEILARKWLGLSADSVWRARFDLLTEVIEDSAVSESLRQMDWLYLVAYKVVASSVSISQLNEIGALGLFSKAISSSNQRIKAEDEASLFDLSTEADRTGLDNWDSKEISKSSSIQNLTGYEQQSMNVFSQGDLSSNPGIETLNYGLSTGALYLNHDNLQSFQFERNYSHTLHGDQFHDFYEERGTITDQSIPYNQEQISQIVESSSIDQAASQQPTSIESKSNMSELDVKNHEYEKPEPIICDKAGADETGIISSNLILNDEKNVLGEQKSLISDYSSDKDDLLWRKIFYLKEFSSINKRRSQHLHLGKIAALEKSHESWQKILPFLRGSSKGSKATGPMVSVWHNEHDYAGDYLKYAEKYVRLFGESANVNDLSSLIQKLCIFGSTLIIRRKSLVQHFAFMLSTHLKSTSSSENHSNLDEEAAENAIRQASTTRF